MNNETAADTMSAQATPGVQVQILADPTVSYASSHLSLPRWLTRYRRPPQYPGRQTRRAGIGPRQCTDSARQEPEIGVLSTLRAAFLSANRML